MGARPGELAPQASILDGATSHLAHLIRAERLRQVVVCTALDRFDGALERRERRDDDDGNPRLSVENLGNDVEARFRTQPQIEHDQFEPAALDGFEGALRGPDAENPRTVGLEAKTKRLPHARVVIDDENAALRRLDHGSDSEMMLE
jgi:hypothetical protein